MAKGYSTDLRARAVALVEAARAGVTLRACLILQPRRPSAGRMGGRQPVTSRRSLAPAIATRRSSSMNSGCLIWLPLSPI